MTEEAKSSVARVLRAAWTVYGQIMTVLFWIALVLSAIALVSMVLVISWLIFSRGVLQRTPFWSEETALLLMVCMGLFGATVAYREGKHINFQLTYLGLAWLFARLAPRRQPTARHDERQSVAIKQRALARSRLIMAIVVDVIVAIFAGFMLIQGGGLVQQTFGTGNTTAALQILVGHTYLMLPIAGLMFLLFSIERIVLHCKGQSAPTQAEGAPQEEGN